MSKIKEPDFSKILDEVTEFYGLNTYHFRASEKEMILAAVQNGLQRQWNDTISPLKEKLNKIANYPLENSGREGCTWGDTEFDSKSVEHGYNLAIETIQSFAKD